jgi:UDP-N-acetylglucosamine 2-epimerase (non-hydrolysing)
MKVFHIVGTRPNFLKVAPVVVKLAARPESATRCRQPARARLGRRPRCRPRGIGTPRTIFLVTVHRPPTGDHPDAFLEVVDALEQVAERRPVLFPVHPPTRVAVQEETTALGVPCFTLRANTERPITVTEGTTPLLEVRPPALARLLEALERSPLRRAGGLGRRRPVGSHACWSSGTSQPGSTASD